MSRQNTAATAAQPNGAPAAPTTQPKSSVPRRKQTGRFLWDDLPPEDDSIGFLKHKDAFDEAFEAANNPQPKPASMAPAARPNAAPAAPAARPNAAPAATAAQPNAAPAATAAQPKSNLLKGLRLGSGLVGDLADKAVNGYELKNGPTEEPDHMLHAAGAGGAKFSQGVSAGLSAFKEGMADRKTAIGQRAKSELMWEHGFGAAVGTVGATAAGVDHYALEKFGAAGSIADGLNSARAMVNSGRRAGALHGVGTDSIANKKSAKEALDPLDSAAAGETANKIKMDDKRAMSNKDGFDFAKYHESLQNPAHQRYRDARDAERLRKGAMGRQGLKAVVNGVDMAGNFTDAAGTFAADGGITKFAGKVVKGAASLTKIVAGIKDRGANVKDLKNARNMTNKGEKSDRGLGWMAKQFFNPMLSEKHARTAEHVEEFGAKQTTPEGMGRAAVAEKLAVPREDRDADRLLELTRSGDANTKKVARNTASALDLGSEAGAPDADTYYDRADNDEDAQEQTKMMRKMYAARRKL